MNKKIVWIANEYNGPGQPRTRQIVLSQYLRELGYDVFIVASTTNNNYQEYDETVNYVEFDGERFYLIKAPNYSSNVQRAKASIYFQRRLWKNRNKLPKPDVIVSDFAGFFGNVFLKWKKKYGTKIIYDILDFWPEGFVEMGFVNRQSMLAKMLYKLEYKSYRNADAIIFSCEGGKYYISDQKWDIANGGKVDISDIGYLNNGVDLPFFDKSKLEYTYEDPDLESNCFKVVYLGSISIFNGLDVVLETAKALKARNVDDVKILIYGCGNKEDELRAIAEKENIDNVVFKGKLDKNFAPYVLSNSNLNLFTFKKMPMFKYGISPNKLFMYFASGKPVLSLIKPAYDLVENEKCGISIDNNPELAADAIIKFKNMSKEEYNSYCQNSRKVAEKFDYKILVNELDRIIKKVL